MLKHHLLAAAATLTLAQSSFAAIAMSPMTTFGGDGWYAPGETVGANTATYLTTDGNQRSIAFNRATGNLLLVNGSGVSILNPSNGARTGFFTTTGVSGGTRALNGIGVTSDGVIYGSSLSIALSAAGADRLRLYRWASESTSLAPTLVYQGDAGLAGARLGDDIDLRGTDAAGQIAMGYGASPAVAGNNGYVIFNTNSGAPTATRVAFTGTPPAAGDFRLGVTFTDADTVWGTQGAGGTAGGRLRRSDFSGSAGTLTGSTQLSSASERGMDYTEVVVAGPNGNYTVRLLSTIDTATSLVRVYDADVVASSAGPVTPLASLDLTGGATVSNGNATSSVAWGAATPNANGTSVSLALYALNTNDGIQAFTVTVPEPASLSALAGLALLGLRRRK